MENLGHNWGRLLAADQPPHAGEIHDSDPEPVEEAVVRHARTPGAVDHVDIGDVKTLAPHQGRKKTVQSVEIGQHQEHIAPERLQAAAGIAGAVMQDGAADGVRRARLEFLEARILAPDALASDETDPLAV